MVEVLAMAVVVSGFVLLGVSAARHVRWREAFCAQLYEQGFWRDGSEKAVASVVTGLEIFVGAGGVLLLSFGAPESVVAPLLVAMIALGVGFVGLQVVLLARHPDAPCGCDPGRNAKVGPGTLLKAAWPVVAGVVGLVALPEEGLNSLSIVAACVAVFAGLGLTWLVDSVPVVFDRA